MKIIVDAFGGDNAPLEILKGSEWAVKELGIDILLVGDTEKIKSCSSENGISLDRMEIKQADDIIAVEDEPKEILRHKSESSMAIALKALSSGEGDAMVSAGSTGALLMGGTFLVKRIKGVRRPAIASVIPGTSNPFLLADCGANVECHPQMLLQFGEMGSIYMKNILGVQNPRIGLANIGVEETKGTDLQISSYELLKESSLNFTGNIEMRDIASGLCDVVVADGWTGNTILKMYEGVASALLHEIKAIFMKNAVSKLSYLGIKGGMSDFKKKMDYKEYGGAPLIGLRKNVIKAHGSCDARAFKNAIRQAVQCVNEDLVADIEKNITVTKNGENEND